MDTLFYRYLLSFKLIRSLVSLEGLNILRKTNVKSIINPMPAACSATRSKVAILKRAAVERKNKNRLPSKKSFWIKIFSPDHGKTLTIL